VKWRIEITDAAFRMLEGIKDRRVQKSIRDRIDNLEVDPDKQGKAMIGELNGFRSLRAVGQRFRIIYRVEKEKVVVLVVAAGLRKDGDRGDIYALAQKLVRLGLLG
jgi:mRNA interferase RelE/StbE